MRAGQRRAGVEILRGNPEQVAAVADRLAFTHRYTSGLIAWAPEDAPDDVQIETVLDAFEQTAWAGLEADRYAWSAVLHREHGGGVHVHIFAARCELETGRSLNIAPPGWQKTFDPLRDHFNGKYGWSRPDDPARARPYQPAPHVAYRNAARLRAGLQVEPDPRQVLGEYLIERVVDGSVHDRASVVTALKETGLEVTRQGEHYVTVRDPESGNRWRLKGALYEHDFDRTRFAQQDRAAAGDREPADRGGDAARAEELWRDLEECRRRRAEYNQVRYGRSNRRLARRGQESRGGGGDGDREGPGPSPGRAAGARIGHGEDEARRCTPCCCAGRECPWSSA